MGQGPSTSCVKYGQGDAIWCDDEICGGGCIPFHNLFVFAPFQRGGNVFELTTSSVEDELPPELAPLEEEDGSNDGDGHADAEKTEVKTESSPELTEHDAGEERTPEPTIRDEEIDVSRTKEIPNDVLSRIVAVDVGMVKIPNAADGSVALRRLTIIDGFGTTILSALVRVDGTSPNNYYSATAKHLASLLPKESRISRTGEDLDLGVPADDVRREVSRLLKGKIVVGHDLRGDLKYLGLLQDVSENKHDFEIRDTATYEPFQIRQGDAIKYRKLSDLTKDRLKRRIQPVGEFHCCEEDAMAALDLYKSVYHDWEARIKSLAEEAERTAKEQNHSPVPHHANVGSSDKQVTLKACIKSVRRSTCQKKKKRKGKHNQTTCKKVATRSWTNNKKKKRQQKRGKSKWAVSTVTSCSSVLSAISQCSCLHRRTRTFLFHYLMLLPFQMIYDLVHLTKEASISTISLLYRKCKRQPLKHSGRSKQKKWERKNKHILHKWRMLKRRYIKARVVRRYITSLFLMCHVILEMYTIYPLLVSCVSSPYAMWDTESIRKASGSFAVGLVWAYLLLKRIPSKDLFQVLAQYRFIDFLLSMAEFGCQETTNFIQDNIDQKNMWLETAFNTISGANLMAAAW